MLWSSHFWHKNTIPVLFSVYLFRNEFLAVAIKKTIHCLVRFFLGSLKFDLEIFFNWPFVQKWNSPDLKPSVCFYAKQKSKSETEHENKSKLNQTTNKTHMQNTITKQYQQQKKIIEKVKATQTKIAICYFRDHQYRYTKRSKAFGYRQHTHEYGIFS